MQKPPRSLATCTSELPPPAVSASQSASVPMSAFLKTQTNKQKNKKKKKKQKKPPKPELGPERRLQCITHRTSTYADSLSTPHAADPRLLSGIIPTTCVSSKQSDGQLLISDTGRRLRNLKRNSRDELRASLPALALRGASPLKPHAVRQPLGSPVPRVIYLGCFLLTSGFCPPSLCSATWRRESRGSWIRSTRPGLCRCDVRRPGNDSTKGIYEKNYCHVAVDAGPIWTYCCTSAGLTFSLQGLGPRP